MCFRSDIPQRRRYVLGKAIDCGELGLETMKIETIMNNTEHLIDGTGYKAPGVNRFLFIVAFSWMFLLK